MNAAARILEAQDAEILGLLRRRLPLMPDSMLLLLCATARGGLLTAVQTEMEIRRGSDRSGPRLSIRDVLAGHL